MLSGLGSLGILILALIAVALPILLIAIAIRLVSFVVRGTISCISHFGGFIGRQLREAAQGALAMVSSGINLALALINGLFLRGVSMRKHALAARNELLEGLSSVYHFLFRNPADVLGCRALLDSIENRFRKTGRSLLQGDAIRGQRPDSVAPDEDFPGYAIVGTLPPGGSGAQLFLARPLNSTTQRWSRLGHDDPGQVVIKSFSLARGSTVPQIVRESRALEAARRLGRILDHELTGDAFWYAMPFVPGETLDVVTARIHEEHSETRLAPAALARILSYSRDILATLHEFHEGGLWHKDIKPTNLIVSTDRVHLVDLGLVTPLASAMTLTTHGTEYYRDPELVRLAMRGVRVHDVNGAQFDLYSAGAVMFSMVQNNFPAQGCLSPISSDVPEAYAWIIRRAMADVENRYSSAAQMLCDLRVLLESSDPYSVRPIDLPSMASTQFHDIEAELPKSPPLPKQTIGSPPTFALRTPLAEKVSKSRDPRGSHGSRFLWKSVLYTAMGMAGLSLLAVLGGSIGGRRAMQSRPGPPSAPSLEPVEATGITRDTERGGLIATKPILTESEWDQLAQVHSGIGASQLQSLKLPPGQLNADAGSTPRLDAAPVQIFRLLMIMGSGVDRSHETVFDFEYALADAGFEILGGAGDARPTSVEYAAQARHAAALGEPSDAEALARVQAFLDRSYPDLSGIVWFYPGSGANEVSHHILTPSSLN